MARLESGGSVNAERSNEYGADIINAYETGAGRREPVYHAPMLDPHTGAELPLDEIEELVDELLWAHRDLVPPLIL